jgi:hypothetical protein
MPPDGSPVLLEEDAATVTKLLAVRLVPKGLKIVFCLFVGCEENQTQELAVDASHGRHARRQKSHMPVAAICVAIIADLVGSGALEDVVRVVGVAELALSLPISTSANEIMTQCDVYQHIGLPTRMLRISRSAAVALAREHPLVSGGETSVVTNSLQRPQYMVMCACPIRGMVEAGVDVVPAPSPPMKYR